MPAQFQKADRLTALTQRMGFALLQLQELESSSAMCFVLLVKASRGMGITAGQALVEAAKSNTFGRTIYQLEKARLLNPDLAAEFSRLLEERNWLVHRSGTDSRGAINGDDALQQQLLRVDAIAHDAIILLKKVGALIEGFVLDRGVSKDDIDRESQRILAQWATGDDA